MTMPKGGHARSGPPPDPNSARSDARGINFTALPANGYDGEVPDYPLPKRVIWNEWFEGSGRDREKRRERDDGATEGTWERELELWAWLWSTPQACAWAQASERWRLHTIAMYVRTFVICESAEATAADKGSLHRFADDIGMTPAGLRVNGWTIASDEVAARRSEAASPEPAAKSSRSRLKSVPSGTGG
jgi:hypothetical protein